MFLGFIRGMFFLLLKSQEKLLVDFRSNLSDIIQLVENNTIYDAFVKGLLVRQFNSNANPHLVMGNWVCNC
jgi:hypothetical protein